MAKYGLGLVSVEMGAIAGDGGMGTVLEAIGNTFQGTATLTTEDPQTTDFFIEEQDDPIESVVTQKGVTSLALSCVDVKASTLQKFFGGSVTPYIAAGGVLTLGVITPGSSYTNGTYTNVPLTGGSGSGATANITVSGGEVTAVTIVNKGAGYSGSDNLSAAASDIGGTGSGFSVVVATVQAQEQKEKWEAPTTAPDIERSIKITDKKGNIVEIPRAKIRANFNWSFTKDNLAQVNMTATVLTPTKEGVAPLSITNYAG